MQQYLMEMRQRQTEGRNFESFKQPHLSHNSNQDQNQMEIAMNSFGNNPIRRPAKKTANNIPRAQTFYTKPVKIPYRSSGGQKNTMNSDRYEENPAQRPLTQMTKPVQERQPIYQPQIYETREDGRKRSIRQGS